MKLTKAGEFGLIEKIRRRTPRGRGVRVGIGDDAAWLDCRSKTFLITTDLLAEGVHFDLRWISFYALGYKTLAVNLSDIAAMGGTPAYVTLALGIPVDFRSEDIEEFYRGLRALASRTGVALVGGDTSAAERFFINATVVGRAPKRPVLRSGARAGDGIYVTGTLGDSALGLELLKKKKVRARIKIPAPAYLIRRHHFPSPRLKTGARLAAAGLARAMIDVSDGLVQDLGHICKASGVGAEIWAEALPLSWAYKTVAGRNRIDAALGGGEDYELLFCVRPSDESRLEKIKRGFGVPVTRIGECVAARRGVHVIDARGNPVPVSRSGHDHFKGNA